MSELVQQLVTENRGFHEQIVEATAIASVTAWLHSGGDPVWGEWLSGRFTKTVRRGTATQVAKVNEWAWSWWTIIGPDGPVTVWAFPPLSPDERDEVPGLSKLQVANFNRPRVGEWPAPALTHGSPVLHINTDVEMSTGKTAAQAAHGLFLWALQHPDLLEDWSDAGYPVTMRERESMALAKLDRDHEDDVVLVHDAGLTEIEPGSLTVLVTTRP